MSFSGLDERVEALLCTDQLKFLVRRSVFKGNQRVNKGLEALRIILGKKKS